MAKIITIKKYNTLEELEHEIKITRDGRYRLRLQVVYLVMQKMHSQEIQSQLMISKPSIFKWVKLYNDKGLEGIKEISQGGRPEGNPKWDDSIFTALFAKLDLMEEFFSIPKMQTWIHEIYGVSIPERTIHHRLSVNNYTFKSSRPNPYKGDPALQAAFKKTEL